MSFSLRMDVQNCVFWVKLKKIIDANLVVAMDFNDRF